MYDGWHGRHGIWNDVGWIARRDLADFINCLAGKANQKVKLILKKKLWLWIFMTGFITNLIWENAQAPLYTGYKGFGQHFLFCLVASVIDGLVVLAFYFIISLIRRDSFWLFNLKPSDILMLCVLGLFTAILFEKWALKSGTWNYTEEMPLIRGMGLMPVLQLAILSIISIYIVKVLGGKALKHN